MAFEPIAAAYEKEHRLRFEAKAPSGDHVVVSGNVNVAADLKGNPDEDFSPNTTCFSSSDHGGRM